MYKGYHVKSKLYIGIKGKVYEWVKGEWILVKGVTA